MKLLFTILIFLLLSCTKGIDPQPKHCETAIELSDKYLQSDSSFIRTDTLYIGRLCDSSLQSFKRIAASQPTTFNLCSIGLLEKRRFIYLP